ncbi:MAG: N-acetyltransferase, partial [Phenylobacterium zucineum]
MKMDDGGYEVAKMTVSETLRGSGLGRLLMQRCIDAGAEAGATRLYLETNSSLGPALGLYRAMGFQDLAPTETPYVRADVFMERRY